MRRLEESRASFLASRLNGPASDYRQKHRFVVIDMKFNFNHLELEVVRPVFNLITLKLTLYAHTKKKIKTSLENKNYEYENTS